MSLGGGADEALDAAVRKSVESGDAYAVAARNESDVGELTSAGPNG